MFEIPIDKYFHMCYNKLTNRTNVLSFSVAQILKPNNRTKVLYDNRKEVHYETKGL